MEPVHIEPSATQMTSPATRDDSAAQIGTSWQQPELIPEPTPWAKAAKPSTRLRQVGLVGIAQAREALAEAAHRAQSRGDNKAA